MARKDDLGRWGEDVASQHLLDSGYAVIERNWRCPSGEIDIIALEKGQLVFVEVKTRSGLAFGHPFEAITAQKLARLRRLAIAWCVAHPNRYRDFRIDAIAVVAPRGQIPTVEQLSGLF